MTIDLSEWNEYIADDVPPGHPPKDTVLETMQIVTANSIFEQKDGIIPGWYRLSEKNEYPIVRFFWRVKR